MSRVTQLAYSTAGGGNVYRGQINYFWGQIAPLPPSPHPAHCSEHFTIFNFNGIHAGAKIITLQLLPSKRPTKICFLMLSELIDYYYTTVNLDHISKVSVQMPGVG